MNDFSEMKNSYSERPGFVWFCWFCCLFIYLFDNYLSVYIAKILWKHLQIL